MNNNNLKKLLVILTLVLDREHGCTYVRTEDVEKWGLKADELYYLAVKNLDVASKNMKAHASESDKARYVGLETDDGYDAARILVPGFRAFVAARLGRPFYFGIPNRDFLICWSADSTVEFTRFTRRNLKKDFAQQPYPLSPEVYRVTADDKIEKAEQTD